MNDIYSLFLFQASEIDSSMRRSYPVHPCVILIWNLTVPLQPSVLRPAETDMVLQQLRLKLCGLLWRFASCLCALKNYAIKNLEPQRCKLKPCQLRFAGVLQAAGSQQSGDPVRHVGRKVEDLQTPRSGRCKSCANVLCTLNYTPSLWHIPWVTVCPTTHPRVLHFSVKAV